jgi:hypothetical protein
MARSQMGFFDALTSSSFKTGQNGRKLFFPWGVLGRSYTIDSEQDYERLRQQVKGYMIVSLVLTISSGSFVGNLASFVIAGLLIGFYLIWMLFVLGRLMRSDERMSLQESAARQAQAHNLVVLWLLEIASVAFVVAGIFMFVVDPRNRLVAFASTLFFGICAAKATYMLVLRYRTAIARP